MEKINSSALAKNYWLTETSVYKKGFFGDYLTNPSKRFETGFAANIGEKFWRQYAEAYIAIRESGSLILRTKLITDDTVTIRQIYRTKKDRDRFLSLIDTTLFYKSIDFEVEEKEEEVNLETVQQFVEDLVFNKNAIVHFLHEEFYLAGITIGDPLKNERQILLN